VVFARLPRDERQAKPIVAGASQPRIEAFHRELLRRAIAVARTADADVRFVTTGDAPALAAAGVEVVRQSGSTFGERLEHAVAGAFAAGWSRVVVIGADSPALDAAQLRAAFAALEADGKHAVLGPASDGGYYLLGLNAFAAAAFRDVPLCTTEAFAATATALARAGFLVDTLATELADVDDDADLRALAHWPAALRRLALLLLSPERRPLVAATTIQLRRTIRSIRVRGPPVPA
jgi:glycosyltransferase A (GT-A) superfamily protein (DUF2064 family)